MKAVLLALVLDISAAYSVPPYLVVAIAEVESSWDATAVAVNDNGTIDRGLMQLNSSWYTAQDWYDPAANVRAAIHHLIYLRSNNLNWWQVVIAYNCGLGRIKNPPSRSIDYAVKVFAVWALYDRGFNSYAGR
jgi:soluble lytic murein transglycosylase-like protein